MMAVILMAGCERSMMDDTAQDNLMLKKGKKAQKVTMRHNGHLINVSANAMDAHFAHGDEMVVTSDDLADDINGVLATPYKWFFL